MSLDSRFRILIGESGTLPEARRLLWLGRCCGHLARELQFSNPDDWSKRQGKAQAESAIKIAESAMKLLKEAQDVAAQLPACSLVREAKEVLELAFQSFFDADLNAKWHMREKAYGAAVRAALTQLYQTYKLCGESLLRLEARLLVAADEFQAAQSKGTPANVPTPAAAGQARLTPAAETPGKPAGRAGQVVGNENGDDHRLPDWVGELFNRLQYKLIRLLWGKGEVRIEYVHEQIYRCKSGKKEALDKVKDRTNRKLTSNNKLFEIVTRRSEFYILQSVK